MSNIVAPLAHVRMVLSVTQKSLSNRDRCKREVEASRATTSLTASSDPTPSSRATKSQESETTMTSKALSSLSESSSSSRDGGDGSRLASSSWASPPPPSSSLRSNHDAKQTTLTPVVVQETSFFSWLPIQPPPMAVPVPGVLVDLKMESIPPSPVVRSDLYFDP